MAFELVLVLVLILVSCSRQAAPLRGRRVTAALITMVFLAPAGSIDPSCVRGAALPGAGKAAAPPAEEAALFRRFCQGCHGADGRGVGKDVPDLTRPAWQEKRSDAQLVVTILEGKGTVMPAFGDRLSPAQAKTLVAHLRSFGPVRPKTPTKAAPSPAAPAGDFDARLRQLQKEFEELKRQMKELTASESDREKPPAQGEAQRADDGGPVAPARAAAHFKQLCRRCHGANGEGVRQKKGSDPPDFTRRDWQERRSDAELLASILDGTEGGMPAFRDRLSKAEVKGLVAQVRSFAPARQAAQKIRREHRATSLRPSCSITLTTETGCQECAESPRAPVTDSPTGLPTGGDKLTKVGT
jgi:mono/diheme cytochrome c family protein